MEISGQGGWDDDINIAEGLEDEIVRAFDNIERTLATAGATWRDVMTAQFRKRMGDRAPIWTQTGVAVLGAPKMHVEIRVTSVVRSER